MRISYPNRDCSCGIPKSSENAGNVFCEDKPVKIKEEDTTDYNTRPKENIWVC